MGTDNKTKERMVFIKNSTPYTIRVHLSQSKADEDNGIVSSTKHQDLITTVSSFEMKDVQYPHFGVCYMVVHINRREVCAYIPMDNHSVIDVTEDSVYAILDGDRVDCAVGCDMSQEDSAFIQAMKPLREGYEPPTNDSWGTAKIILLIIALLAIGYIVYTYMRKTK